MKKTSIYLLLTAALTFWATCALAGVSGSCANCHTMHNSQDNDAFAQDGNGDDYAVKGSLTIGGCVGCHTGTNAGGSTPFVNTASLPVYGPEYTGSGTFTTNTTTLAGGNFYWVATAGGNTASKGHNVISDGLAIFDMDAPGRTAGQTAFSSGASTSLTCAGTMGCHGNRGVAGDYASISGSHHGGGVAAGYRFLDGIGGIEDSDWEYTVSATDHNSYKAEARAEGATMNDGGDTISSLCGQCHGDFHSGASKVNDGSAWLRHPTDILLPAGEYQSYKDGETAGIYNPVAPVGLATPATGDITVDKAIVTCISCHRAHGSPYADLLRWNYVDGTSAGAMTGGKANNGCFACHTTKDD